MKTNIQRYLVPGQGPDLEALKECLALAVKVSREKELKMITLLVPMKSNFENSVVADLLGKKVIKTLLKGQKVKAIDDIYMELESIQTFSEYATYEMIIGIYLSQKGIDVLDSVRSVKAIIFLPWLKDEVSDWIARWNPSIVGEPALTKPPSILDPTALKKLRDLTSGINLSTGLGHPSDKQAAKDTFSKLRSEGIGFDPNDIKNWAIQNGWHPQHADRLAKLSEKYMK